MKRYIALFACLIMYSNIAAQPLPDSVKSAYNSAATDYAKNECLHSYLESIRSHSNFNSIASELQHYFLDKDDQSSSDYVELTKIGMMSKTGDFVNALDKSLELVSVFRKRKDEYGELLALYRVCQAMYYSGDVEQAGVFSLMQLPLAHKLQNYRELALCYNGISTFYAVLNMPDSGVWYGFKALEYAAKTDKEMIATVYGTLAENFIAQKDFDSAIIMSKMGIPLSSDAGTTSSLYGNITKSFLGKQQYDSTRHYAGITIAISKQHNFSDQLQLAYECLYHIYEQKGNTDSAFKYYKLSVQTRDALFTSQKATDVRAINLREQARKQKAEQEKADFENKVKFYALLCGLLLILIVAFILYRNNRQKQKVNLLLQDEKQKVEITLSELKSTQSQLIQSEKMASLGELTAGIAHEIQNPLNFVNNFSEVSKELLDEMKTALNNGDTEDAKEIATDVIQNLEKINHHGKRADAIVKGMLQHSQTSKGQIAPTDINALADEYLRLAYHGLRAKDKSFNATLKTDFDEGIGNINIIPQDIGRVILNLITNAFYAVDQKKKQLSEGNEPTVSVSTKQANDKIEIHISDNGNGIPENIIEKIFQPFFTTKPTGQGTGLGLSLAYDIVKAHGGELNVETSEGKGTTFIIIFPKNN